MKEQYRVRRDRLLEGLGKLPGLKCERPRGAFYVFVDVRPWLGKTARGTKIETDLDLATWLLEHLRLALVPGTAFGAPGFLRLSYAASLAEIDQAIECLTVASAELGG
jgi:aspartate aminotransferase